MEEVFLPLMRKCCWHNLLLSLLSKGVCGQDKIDDIMAHPGDYWNQKDYMDALHMIFNQQTQGDHFGETRNIGMEPSCGQYRDPTSGEEKYIHQGFVHEIKRQDARTTF